MRKPRGARRIRRAGAMTATIMASAMMLAPAAQAADISLTPVTDAMLQDPDPAGWLMWRRTLNSWGHSPLRQIDRANVADLRMVWARGLPTGSQEGTPLVHEGVMVFPGPNDVIQAFDAVSGDMLWEYRGELPDDLGDYLPAQDINRNLAIFDNLIVDTSADSQMFALDVATGELVWKTRVHDYRRGSQQTSGPIIANGKAIAGRGCEPEGGPEACVITAHDALTGEELWRTRTIPAPGEPGDETWGGVPYEERIHVGTWMVPSFDPELNLIFIGTSVSAPAPKYQLGGNEHQYLYHNSTLALDADDGRIVWHYQHLVDHWDMDHPFERLILETEIAPDPDAVDWINPNLRPGERRTIITGIPGKSGIVYTLDAATGEFLWARPTVHQNLVAEIDGATGAVIPNPETLMDQHGDQVEICPGPLGGKNWPAGAYSPGTGAIYMPVQNTCSAVTAVPADIQGAGVYGIRTTRMEAPGAEDGVGSIHAIEISSGRTRWVFQTQGVTLSLLATDGGLIFGGDSAGRFRALDHETGEMLWEINLGAPISGFPVTYSVDGRQYVAVSTGATRLAPLASGLRTGAANNLFVFALP